MNFHKMFQTSFSAVSPLKSNDQLFKSVMERTEKMENRKKISVKKPIIAVCAVIAAAALGITAAAESAEFQKFIYTTTGFVIDPDKIVYATGIPQKPIDGFSELDDVGTPIAECAIKESFPTEKYAVKLKETAENKFTVEKIAYGNGQTMVLGDGIEFKENQHGKITIDADFTAEYHTDQNGELVAVGYIYDNVAYEIFSGRTDGEALSVDFTADKAGEYRFYITNCCAGLQNYDSVSVEVLELS